MKFCFTLAATLLIGAVSLEAHAQQQPWLADRQYGEGIGIRVGNLELHPGVAGEVGYDSNYFLRAPSEDPLAAYRLRVTPSLSLATLGPQRRASDGAPAPQAVTFRAGVYVAFNYLIAADSKHSSEFSNQNANNTDVGADLALQIAPQGRVGADLYGGYVRSIQPSNDTDTENAFNRDTVHGGGGVTWRPGGGLFDWRLGGEAQYNYFEKTSFANLNNSNYQVNMRGRWRFLPRTALLYEGSYTWISYADPTTQNDGQILRTRIGINGLVSTRFSLLAMVGWAGSFYEAHAGGTPQQFDSIIGQAELKWFLSGPQETLNAGSTPAGVSYATLGYSRDVANSYLGNFYRRDRGYVGISYLLGGVFVASLNAGIANLAFPDSFFADGQQEHGAFNEQRVDVNLFGEYRFSNTFGLNTTINYDQNITGTKVNTAENGPPQLDDLAFSRWQVFIGARFFW